MKVKLRNPDRIVEVAGPTTVLDLLRELDIVPEAVLVIRDSTLITRDEKLTDADELEVRPVLSGGAAEIAGSEALRRTSPSPRTNVRRAPKQQAGADEAPPVAGLRKAISRRPTDPATAAIDDGRATR